MTDAFGHRAVFSVVLPATNAITEPEIAALRTPGVSNQTFRFPFPGRPQNLDDLITWMGPAITSALDCQPDRIIVAFSTEFLPDGFGIASQLREYVEGIVKRPTTMASEAVPEALKVLRAENIGIVTPYPPETNRNVRSYFTELGFNVSNIIGITRTDRGRIDTARISEAEVRNAIGEIDAAEVDAIVQTGTAMICAGFSADLEKRHGKPVVAVNAATYWMALRRHGISDQLGGYGKLLEEY